MNSGITGITREVLDLVYALYLLLLPFRGVVILTIIAGGLVALYRVLCDDELPPPAPEPPQVPAIYEPGVRDAGISVLADNDLFDDGNPQHRGGGYGKRW